MSIHDLELLAPVGKMDVLASVIKAGADAVYLGGKRFNMRALRPDFNFCDEEIKQAADILHQNNRKLYITVNNLYNGNEIDEIVSYLFFLKDLGADALIVQDLGVAELCQKFKLDIPLHASVQMGIANIKAVRILEQNGFKRVILSKNLSSDEIAAISAHTHIGIEFFVHGDLCISHTGQCYMSSFTGGESGNRGRCNKPCRWPYQLLKSNQAMSNDYQYLLAHKDLCLYPHLPELVNAGVSSFKIEGRMRSADYLAFLVSTYRHALDRLADDPVSYKMDQQELLNLQEHRLRDYTNGNLFERMGRSGIGFDGHREPFFISEAQPISSFQLADYQTDLTNSSQAVPELTVKVGGLDSFKGIYGLGVKNIILGSEIIRQNQQNWTLAAIRQACDMSRDTESRIFLETPRIVSQNDLGTIRQMRNMADSNRIYGIVLNDLGSLELFQDSQMELWGGFGLNIFNHRAAEFYQENGIRRITASLEMGSSDLKSLLISETPVELMVHGPLPGMVSDYCLARAAQPKQAEECAMYCMRDGYTLIDRCEQKYKIFTDDNCRNYIFLPYDLCLLPYLPRLSSWGLKSFRIDGQYYDPEKLALVVVAYNEALQQIKCGQWNMQENYSKLIELFPNGLTAALIGQTID